MHHATLCYIFDENKILLAMKKRGFGAGKLNGYGGKVENGETYESAAVRETKEESGLDVQSLKKVAELDFKFTNAPPGKDWDQIVHVYFTKKYAGSPVETEEMKPEWFEVDKIPIDKFWDSDRYWFPLLLEGKKIYGKFVFGEDNNTVKEYELKETENFEKQR